MDGIEVPHYFLCPISLQIMRDPVTVSTGMTYDRESIEKWLFSGGNSTCPVTQQQLQDSDLTPNHTLRRLIQAWCTINASNGVERIPTPKAPIDKIHIAKVIQDLHGPLDLQIKSVEKFKTLISESDRNKKVMEEAGACKNLILLIIRCSKTDQMELQSKLVEEALSILHLLHIPKEELKFFISDSGNYVFIESLTWVLIHGNNQSKFYSLSIMKVMLEAMESNQMKLINSKFLEGLVQILRDRVSHQTIKASLQILKAILPWGRNRNILAELGVIFELIELLIDASERRIIELILVVLDLICACADGRAKLLEHAAGMAAISKKILRVSASADDRAIGILSSICRFSATPEILHEMLAVGAVSKFCMVMQSECTADTKEKAKMVLRFHSRVWKNSSCIDVYFLARYP